MTSLSFKQLDSDLKKYEATIKVLETTNSKNISWGQIYLLKWALKSHFYSLIKYIAQGLRYSSDSPSKRQILDILIARDAVQVALKAHNPVPVWNLLQVEDLDNRLKQQSDLIVKTINLAEWRSLINPSISNWWWFLDESPFHPQNHRNWLWKSLSIFLLTISFAFGTSVYSAWFSVGLDALGSSFASAQGVATLFLGSRLFTTEENKPLLGYSKIPRYVWHQRIFQGSFLLTGLVLGLYFLQPVISDLYTKRGINNYNAIPRQIAKAKANFQRATELDPDNAEAHYGLGNIYEELGKLEQAQTEYEIAAQGALPDAHNNLARLYILHQQFDKAAILLEKWLEQFSQQDQMVEYSMRKNLGWARLEQKRYDRAEAELREAIQLTNDLKRNEAAPYCLLAQVLDCKGNLAEANNNWQNCKKYANPSNSPEEDSWLHLANQRLKQGEKPSCDTEC